MVRLKTTNYNISLKTERVMWTEANKMMSKYCSANIYIYIYIYIYNKDTFCLHNFIRSFQGS